MRTKMATISFGSFCKRCSGRLRVVQTYYWKVAPVRVRRLECTSCGRRVTQRIRGYEAAQDDSTELTGELVEML